MTKHQLVEAAPIMMKRVLGNDHRTTAEKVEFLDFLKGSLDRAADRLDPLGDLDLYRPLADLFGRIESEKSLLLEE
tara:strand:+ start:330 stop:557 length:228 start_codon:yes stop_codon:yes gene_type:complete